LQDKVNKLTTQDKIKAQEIDLMYQKIKDFEIILEENSNQYFAFNSRYLDTIKNQKQEIESYKNNNIDYEKLIDILNYFFKKIQTMYQNPNTQK
jgi:hypothetical protein